MSCDGLTTNMEQIYLAITVSFNKKKVLEEFNETCLFVTLNAYLL